MRASASVRAVRQVKEGEDASAEVTLTSGSAASLLLPEALLASIVNRCTINQTLVHEGRSAAGGGRGGGGRAGRKRDGGGRRDEGRGGWLARHGTSIRWACLIARMFGHGHRVMCSGGCQFEALEERVLADFWSMIACR